MIQLNDIIVNINDFVWTYILIAALLLIGLYFTIKTRFVQFRYISHMFSLLGEGISDTNNKNRSVSSFQAFCISTASRIGTGNLAGIATAISIGGAGAIFWMWLIAIIGAASSFIESTLAQIYKRKSKDSYIGGPAYYIQYGLGKRWLGVIFAILITITFGLVFNSVQANTITYAFDEAFGLNRVVVGVVLTVISLIVIFGGVHRIAVVSTTLIPIMAIAYIAIALYIVVTNIGKLPEVFSMILGQAFGIREVAGGALGVGLMQGIKRGLFSNEAGMGSAPNAAAAAEVSHPVKQGFIQTLGVFTDTLIICSCTAFIILISDVPLDGSVKGIQLTQMALNTHISSTGSVFIAITVLFFAFSSIVGNYYYGEVNIRFITKNVKFIFAYRLFVGLMIIFGSIVSVDLVWNMADLSMAFMAIVNLIAISLLGRIAFLALKDYITQRKAGIKSPKFKSSTIPELKGKTETWD